jgi:hypothetical protein
MLNLDGLEFGQLLKQFPPASLCGAKNVARQ